MKEPRCAERNEFPLYRPASCPGAAARDIEEISADLRPELVLMKAAA